MAKRARKPATKKSATPDMNGVGGLVDMDLSEDSAVLLSLPPGMTNPPPRVIDGHPNPEYGRWRMALVQNLEVAIITGARPAPKGWDVAKSTVAAEREMLAYGIDPKHLKDVRSEGEKMLDAAAQFCADPRSALEWSDDELDAVLAGMDRVEGLMQAEFDERLAANAKKSGVDPGDDPMGKIRRVLLRVKEARERARNPIPKTSSIDGDKVLAAHKYRDWILEASHLARHMLYVARSTVAGKTGGKAVLDLDVHHIKIIGDLWQAYNSVMFHPASSGAWEGRIDRDPEKYRWEGAIEMAPPGHGKTTIDIGWCVTHISLNPDAQGSWLHDVEDVAKKNVEAVKNFFKRDNEYGRRNLALFPHLRLAKTGNTTGNLKLHLDRPVEDPTLAAYAVFSSRLSANNSFQILDDIVPQADCHEHSTRERRSQTIGGTWKTRLREGGFRIVSGYMWHHDDALAKLYAATRRSSHPIMYISRIQRCRRVVSHSGQERFIPLWKKAYPGKRLSAMYHELTDKRIWYSNYEGQPKSEDQQIIRKLRLFDPELPDHRVFLDDALTRGHVSLDPAWTNREHSDKAGMVIGAAGYVKGIRRGEFGHSVASEGQIRITHARADRATAEGMKHNLEYLIDAADGDRVTIDEMHIETNSGGNVIAETLENQYGITVNKHFAGKSKEIRLRRVMGMIDDSNKDRRACVLFPGKAKRDGRGELVLDDDGEPIIERDPDWEWLYMQFYDFGFTKEDHNLDAVTQLANALSADITPGKGVITRAFQKSPNRLAGRKALHLAKLRSGRKQETDVVEAMQLEDQWSMEAFL